MPPGQAHRVAAPPSLKRHDVHVWLIPAATGGDLSYPRALERLTAAEHERAEGYRHEDDRRRFVVGRGAVRALLEAYGAGPAVELAIDARGRPSLPGSGMSFNVSHSGEWVACAFARRPVGIDIEQRLSSPAGPTLVERICTPREAAALDRLEPALRAEEFLRVWVRKEAVGKATGAGLDLPLGKVDVSGAVARQVPEPGRWRVRDIPVADGYRGAVAARGLAWRARRLRP